MKTCNYTRRALAGYSVIIVLGCMPPVFAQTIQEAADSARARGDFGHAIKLYQQVLKQEPGNTEALFSLALTLSYQGRFRESSAVFDTLLALNPSNVEALCGKARATWYGNKPNAALSVYRTVLAIDPDNQEALSNSKRIRSQKRVHLSASAKMISEVENGTSHTESAMPLQEYRLAKRVNDILELQAGGLGDWSKRYYRTDDRTIDTLLQSRWYDNYYLRTIFYLGKQKIYIHGGYSRIDACPSGLVAAWTIPLVIGRCTITNTLDGGYDYFYHWSRSGKDFIGDNLHVAFGRLSMELRGHAALVRPQTVFSLGQLPTDTLWQQETRNMHYASHEEMRFSILEPPSLSLWAAHDFSDYTKGSHLYYTPHRRNVLSGGLDFSGKLGIVRYALGAGAGYDDGGKNLNGSQAVSGIYGNGSLELGVQIQQAYLACRGSIFRNARYQAYVYGLVLDW